MTIQDAKKLTNNVAKACKACQASDTGLAIKAAMSVGVRKYIKKAGLSPVSWARAEATKAVALATTVINGVGETVFPNWATLGITERFGLLARCQETAEQAKGLQSLAAAKAVLRNCATIKAILGTEDSEATEATEDSGATEGSGATEAPE